MTTDAFGVEKAWKGEEGDKRNTKYWAAYGGGATAGGLAGRRIAVGSPSLKEVKAGRNNAMISAWKNGEGIMEAGRKAPNVTRMRVGGSAGAVAGGLLAAGGYAAYRHGQSGKRRIGASIAGQEARRSAELASLRSHPNKSKVEKKKDRGWGFDSEDARQRSAANIKSKAGYTKKGERPGKNWRTVGAHTGIQAGTGALIGGGLAASGPHNPRTIAAGAGIGAGIGALSGALSGAAVNEVRAGRDAQNEALAAGDWRAARKGERASQYHDGVIVPKAKYLKAHRKAVEAENASLRQRLAEREANVSYIHKSAFGVTHEYDSEEIAKLAIRPLMQAAKAGFKGGVTPYASGTSGARAASAGAGIKSGIGQIKTGLGNANKFGQKSFGQAKGFAAAHPTAAVTGAVGGTAAVAGGTGFGMGRRKQY